MQLKTFFHVDLSQWGYFRNYILINMNSSRSVSLEFRGLVRSKLWNGRFEVPLSALEGPMGRRHEEVPIDWRIGQFLLRLCRVCWVIGIQFEVLSNSMIPAAEEWRKGLTFYFKGISRKACSSLTEKQHLMAAWCTLHFKYQRAILC